MTEQTTETSVPSSSTPAVHQTTADYQTTGDYEKALDLKIKDARELIAVEIAKPGLACITSSFQAECVVLLHLLIEQRPDVPVLFLETGYHFPETLAYRDQMTRDWNLNLVNLEAEQSVKEQESLFGILNQ